MILGCWEVDGGHAADGVNYDANDVDNDDDDGDDDDDDGDDDDSMMMMMTTMMMMMVTLMLMLMFKLMTTLSMFAAVTMERWYLPKVRRCWRWF